ncbi:MAG: hypothetical protein GY849_21065 [Deltaproteobacteria bacterium]|nr:hypothetical protein [Deltaproteobacteria bacterium]
MKRFLSLFLALFLLSGIAFAGSQQTSSTAASTIITNARSLLNEASASFWTDAELLVWLNDGMLDIAARSHCLEETESVNLVADTIEYSISANYVTVKAVVYVNASGTIKGLTPGNVSSVGNVDDVDEPVYWYDFAGKIGIYPPLSSVTTETVTLYLISRPTAIISSANVTTPAVYDHALTLYIVGKAHLKDRQTGRYHQVLGLYMAELERIRKDIIERPQAGEIVE